MVHRTLRAVAVAAAVLLLAACAPDGDLTDPTVDPGEVDGPTPTPTDEADMELSGTFSGDPQLEGGCAWVETADGTRYEVMWPEGYEVTWDPLGLRGPDGEAVAGDGDELRVTGTVADDMASICMVGPIVQASTVGPG